MHCNICNGEEWTDMNGRKAVRCKTCGSFERTRLFYLYFRQLKLPDNARILHIAPEKGLYDVLSANPHLDYTVADIDPARYAYAKDCRFIDLTAMEDWPSNQFDLIMHIHVMEHIPCNLAYPMFHIHRMLKENGLHLCIIPFLSGHYDETYAEIGDNARTKRFGQYDHVRRLGREDISSHLGSIVNLPETFDATRDFSMQTLRAANIPTNHWKGFHIGTVLKLKKYDYKLSF